MERRLTTILAADIAGFSRLVSGDEEGALAKRRGQRRDIIDPLLATYSGRVANTAGDSLLIEFPSSVEGVRFALGLQTAIETAEAEHAEDARMLYRIGLNVGDVVAEGEDLLGDGVNIAARLEALASPGGVVISRTARDQVRDRLDLDLVDLGEVTVKNIARPVRAFQVVREGEARMAPPAPARKSRTPLVIAAAVALVVIVGAGWWWGQRNDFAPVDPGTMALTLPERPSIVVLPFEDIGGDPAKTWIGEGITENIISTLSLSPDLVVMGRATSASYKGKQVTPRDVARELGVRYVLSGSVQNVGDKARITAELSDTIEGQQLWSIREDSDIDDIFEVQDQIAQKLFLEMQVSLTVGEAGRTISALSGDFETSIRVLRGRDAFQRFSPEGHAEAARIWGEIVETNPASPMGPYLQAWLPWQRVILGVSKDPAADYAESLRLANVAIEMEAFGDPYSLIALVQASIGRYDEAKAAATRALELSPGGADVQSFVALALYFSGDFKGGIKHMLEGMRLEPDYPEWVPGQLYPMLLEDGQFDETIALATEVLGRQMRDIRAHPQAGWALMLAHALKGDFDKARPLVQNALKANPNLTIETMMAPTNHVAPRPFHDRMRVAFLAAGVPPAGD